MNIKKHFDLTLGYLQNIQIHFLKKLFFKMKMTELAWLFSFPLLPLKHKQKHSKLPDPKSDKNYNFLAFLICFWFFFKSRIVNNSANVNKVQCFRNGGIQNRNYFVNLIEKMDLCIPWRSQSQIKVLFDIQRSQGRNGDLREKKILQHVI